MSMFPPPELTREPTREDPVQIDVETEFGYYLRTPGKIISFDRLKDGGFFVTSIRHKLYAFITDEKMTTLMVDPLFLTYWTFIEKPMRPYSMFIYPTRAKLVVNGDVISESIQRWSLSKLIYPPFQLRSVTGEGLQPNWVIDEN